MMLIRFIYCLSLLLILYSVHSWKFILSMLFTLLFVVTRVDDLLLLLTIDILLLLLHLMLPRLLYCYLF